MVGMDDKELIKSLQEGDLEVLGEIYNRYHQMVYRTALAITGDPEAASDLSQDVFLRLHHYADRIDHERPLEPWIYRITANLSYTWVKRHHRGLRLVEEMAERLLPGVGKLSPHELAEEREAWEQVQQALLALPIAQRVVVVMYYLNDLSLQEIADTLDIPIGTVKSRLHYGRRKLQNSLGLSYLKKSKEMPKLASSALERNTS